MARRNVKTRDELEELDEAYVHLAGNRPTKHSGSILLSVLLIILLLCGIALAIYLIFTGKLAAL